MDELFVHSQTEAICNKKMMTTVSSICLRCQIKVCILKCILKASVQFNLCIQQTMYVNCIDSAALVLILLDCSCCQITYQDNLCIQMLHCSHYRWFFCLLLMTFLPPRTSNCGCGVDIHTVWRRESLKIKTKLLVSGKTQ